jgi:5-methyltetrahydrofolate--homocysteine methyltransferase
VEKHYEAVREHVVEGQVTQTENAVRKALDAGCPPEEILRKGLLAGMDEVGALFKDGEMFVPEVLVSAKAMKGGMEILRPFLATGAAGQGGRILTATVEGDLHDIGVKLVGMMLEGAGFEVRNLGVDLPAARIVEEVRSWRPHVLGLSAMLTTTMTNMKGVVESLREEGLAEGLAIMVGGAPVSKEYAERLGVHYSADAAEAVGVAKALLQKFREGALSEAR